MKKQLLIFGTLILMSFTVSAQTIWQEDFESYAAGTGIAGDNNGTPSGDYPAGVTKWVIDLSGANLDDSATDYVKVNNGTAAQGDVLKARDTNGTNGDSTNQDASGEAKVTFQSVDLSTQTGDVTIKIGALDFFLYSTANGTWFSQGYLDVEYSLDGGSTFTKVPNYMSEGNADHTFFRVADSNGTGSDGTHNIAGINIVIPDATIGAATSIIVRFKMRNDGGTQEIRVDDVEITRNAVALFSEDFESYAASTGLIGTLDPATRLPFKKVGDYVTTGGVTKWTLDPTDSKQMQNNADHAKTKSINGSLALHFNDLKNEVTFETETIDITGKTQITFGLDLTRPDSGGTYESSDYFDVYSSIDNGVTYTLAQDNGAGHTFSGTNNLTNGVTATVNFSETLSGLSATQLKLKFVARNNHYREDFDVDNIKVVEGGTLSVASNELVGMKMYPNPVKNNIINITSPIKSLPITINIYDITGKSLFNTKTTNTTVSLPNLPKGIYIAKFIQDGKSAVKKLIFQ